MVQPVKNSLKWGYFDDDVLPAWVAEMDFGIAPAVAEALHAAIDRADTGYFSPAALEAMAEAASSYWADSFGWVVPPEHVFALPDVIEGGRRAIFHLTRPGSDVIIPTPAYYPFFFMVERAQRELVEVRSHQDSSGKWALDLDGIEAALEAGAGSVVLCNPWNPVGRSFSADEIRDLIDVVSRYDARIISDEIHAPLTYPENTHTPAASIDPDRVITITSASKGWNLPGLKAAQIVLTNADDRKTWEDYFTLPKIGVSTLGLIGNTAAYNDGREWLAETMIKLESNRRLLGELLAEHVPDVQYFPPEATYLAWLDFQSHNLEDPGQFCLDQAQVAVNEGHIFGPGGEDCVRLNFATTPELLTEMVERIGRALRAD